MWTVNVMPSWPLWVDVISTWAGVRPLIAPRHQEAGAPSDVSRSHVIRMTDPGWFDVAGGKLTTYRRMAEAYVHYLGRYVDRSSGLLWVSHLPMLLDQSALLQINASIASKDRHAPTQAR